MLAAALAALALAAPAAAQQPADTTPTVSADGIGFATLAPDLAELGVTIRARARTSARARDAANRTVAAVLGIANRAGVAADDIRTVGLNVSRQRVRPRRGRPFVRYNARQFLVIRVRDVSRLGSLVDAVAEAGADAVGEPEFGFADPSAGRLLATRAALADARRRADDAAATQGLRITGVRSVVLAPDAGGFEGFATGGDDSQQAAAAPTRVLPGTQQFVERVRVVYTAAPV